MAPVGRPRQHHFEPDELRRRLTTAPLLHVARHYGVSAYTMWRRRHELDLPPFRTVGRPLGSGEVEAAIVQAIQPGQWTSASQLRRAVPGSRQRVYELLARLCAEGTLKQRGQWGTYEWTRRQDTP